MTATDGQRRVLRAIHSLTGKQGFPPSLREIAAEIDVRSLNGVAEHVAQLERKGLVSRARNTARSLRITTIGAREI